MWAGILSKEMFQPTAIIIVWRKHLAILCDTEFSTKIKYANHNEKEDCGKNII